jgi:hypothetical protein
MSSRPTMSEAPTAEKAYTTLKAIQLSGDNGEILSGDDDEVINYSSNRIGSSIAVGVLLSSIMSMWTLL